MKTELEFAKMRRQGRQWQHEVRAVGHMEKRQTQKKGYFKDEKTFKY